MHIQPFQAIYPDMGLISSPDHFFSTVKEKFHEYWESGFYQSLPTDSIYIQKIDSHGHTFIGMIACVDIQDYLGGKIKRHENTLAASEQEQIHLLLHRSAQVKPVMLTYRGVDEINEICKNYIESNPHFLEAFFESSGQRQYFWKVDDGNIIHRIQTIFNEKIGSAYIADGHHRTSSTALMYERAKEEGREGVNPFKWMPCCFYATSEMEIYDFNRIVEGLSDFSPVAFMAKLSQLFELETLSGPSKPSKKHEMTLFLEDEWFLLHWRKEVLEEYASRPAIIDTELLNDKVLKHLLGVEDVRTDKRVKYHPGIKSLDGLREKTLKGDQRMAFCLYPLTMEDFLTVSDAGGVLPPKSTWFEPRIRSGLLVRRFDY